MGVSADDRHRFEELGWLHLGPVFRPEELESIRAEYDRLTAQPMRLAEDGRTPFDYVRAVIESAKSAG